MTYLKYFNNLILVSNNFLSFYLFNDIYFFKFSISKNNIKTKFNSVLLPNKFFFCFFGFLITLISNSLKNLNILKFTKIKFSGKGYRVYKKKKYYIYAQLGYSHKLFTQNFNNIFKFYGKYRFFIFFINNNVNNFINKLLWWRFINIFTLKGFRKFNQIIYKKKGKISSYR